MQFLSTTQGLIIIAVFAVLMLLLTWKAAHNHNWSATLGGFLYAKRTVATVPAAFSIAASWIWAPALFISVQKSYELGLAGIFWFTAPNVLSVFIYIVLGPAIRRRIPQGYSIPDWVKHRFSGEGDKAGSLMHTIFLVPHIWYQIMAVTVQLFVGGLIINYLTGIPAIVAMLLMLAVVLLYSYIAGLRASIITDILHILFLLGGIGLVVPMLTHIVGVQGVVGGLSGIKGSANIFDPAIAFSFGIVTSISLLSGSIVDQQFWQRCFAIREDRIVPAFLLGGLIFAIVPIALSVIGFVAANPSLHIIPPAGTGLPMIGVATAQQLLPSWVLLIFVVMLLSGLTSSLDSALIAGASLYAVDMRGGKEEGGVSIARKGMLGFALIGLITAFIVWHIFPLDRLWWLFNGIGTIFAVPTVLSIFFNRLSVRGVILGLAASVPAFAAYVYANYIQDDALTVYSALAMLAINLFFCLVFKVATTTMPIVEEVENL